MAGRPSNASKKAVSDEVKIETKQETKTPEFDIKSLIQQVTQEVSEKLKNEYEGKITELENKLLKANEKSVEVPNVENKVKSTKSKFKFIPDNTKVRLKSNIGGLFTFNEDRGKIRSYFQIDNFGQGVTISFEELNLFLSSKPTFIKSGAIAIVDAYSDIDIEVEDIIRDLRLDDLYFNDKKINPMRIEDLFDDKITSEKEFADKLNNSIEMAETILEASYVLYRKGLFANNTKMNTLRVIFNRPNLFK
jgi:ribosomal protein S17E